MTSYDTAPAIIDSTQPAALGDRVQYAKALAGAGLLPSAYRDKPANVLVAIETGTMLGIAPMAAIQNVHVIEGKPTFSAGLMAALVRRAGHTVRITGDNEKAVATIERLDDPGFEFRAEWTVARAKQAGLTGKGPWKAYPAAMLKARAISEVARDACQDVFLGPVYVPEELGAEVDQDGTPDQTEQPAQTGVQVVADNTVAAQAEQTDWEAARAGLVDRMDPDGLRDLWHQAKAANAGPDVLHRIARDGREVTQATARADQHDQRKAAEQEQPADSATALADLDEPCPGIGLDPDSDLTIENNGHTVGVCPICTAWRPVLPDTGRIGPHEATGSQHDRDAVTDETDAADTAT